jgi:hypothetical protein
MYLIQNGLKENEVLSPQLLHLAVGYAIRKVQEDQEGLKLNEIHQHLVYADGVNMLGYDINTMKTNEEALTDARRKIGLKVYIRKTKYTLMSPRCRTVMTVTTVNRSLENVKHQYFILVGKKGQITFQHFVLPSNSEPITSLSAF